MLRIYPAGAVPGWAGGVSSWGTQDPATGQEDVRRDYTNIVRRGGGGRSARYQRKHEGDGSSLPSVPGTLKTAPAS